MGNIISRIHDDYDEYVYLCKKIGVEPRPLQGDPGFYDHEEELAKKHGYTKTYYGYEKIEK